MNSRRLVFGLLVLCAMAFAITFAASAFERAVGVCIRNCAQCKKMFGPYFLGEKCADSCVKYKGKLIPDCEDEVSIQPFLQALNASDPRFTSDSTLCSTNCHQCYQIYREHFNFSRCFYYCNSNWQLKVLPDCTTDVTGIFFPPAHLGLDNETKSWQDTCLVNCIQTKQTYEQYFLLGACGEYCLSDQQNKTIPDVESADTINAFLNTSVISTGVTEAAYDSGIVDNGGFNSSCCN